MSGDESLEEKVLPAEEHNIFSDSCNYLTTHVEELYNRFPNRWIFLRVHYDGSEPTIVVAHTFKKALREAYHLYPHNAGLFSYFELKKPFGRTHA